jgi:fructose-bisphosphate aldolase class 1
MAVTAEAPTASHRNHISEKRHRTARAAQKSATVPIKVDLMVVATRHTKKTAREVVKQALSRIMRMVLTGLMNLASPTPTLNPSTQYRAFAIRRSRRLRSVITIAKACLARMDVDPALLPAHRSQLIRLD